MVNPTVDLTGRRFGKWYVEGRDPYPPSRSTAAYWFVLCDCGNESSVRYSELINGHSTGCRPCLMERTIQNPEWIKSGTRASMKRRGFIWEGPSEEDRSDR